MQAAFVGERISVATRTTVYLVYHTPLGRFSKLVPIVSHTERYIFGKLSGRDDSNADRLGSDTIPTVEMSIVENRPRGV